MGIFSSSKKILYSQKRLSGFQRARNNPVLKDMMKNPEIAGALDRVGERDEINRDILAVKEGGFSQDKARGLLGKYMAGRGRTISRKEGWRIAKAAGVMFRLGKKRYTTDNKISSSTNAANETSPSRLSSANLPGKAVFSAGVRPIGNVTSVSPKPVTGQPADAANKSVQNVENSGEEKASAYFSPISSLPDVATDFKKEPKGDSKAVNFHEYKKKKEIAKHVEEAPQQSSVVSQLANAQSKIKNSYFDSRKPKRYTQTTSSGESYFDSMERSSRYKKAA